MKRFKYIFLAFSLLICFSSFISAQEMRYERVDFKIKKIKQVTGIFNDTILNLKIQFFSQEGSSLIFEGVGTLSMCNCYCDSIWDAWPVEVGGGGIPGTATIGLSSSGSGNNIGSSGLDGVLPTGSRNGRRRGSFAIDYVEGGILSEGDEFVVPITFRLK